MKKIHNEHGYTLLLTMVLITVVVLLFATFTIKAFSQQKQVEKTDENYEVTAIAEMGVEYYRAGIINLIKKHSEITKLNIEKTANLDNSKIQNIKSDQMIELKKEIGNFLIYSKNNKINVPSSSESIFFMIPSSIKGKDSIVITNNTWEIYVTGYINNESKSKTISVIFELPTSFDLVATNLISGDGTPNGSKTGDENTNPSFPSFPPFNIGNITFENIIPRLTKPITNFENVIPKSSTSYFFNDDFNMNVPIDSTNTTIQSNGNITLQKAINNMQSMKIHSEKKVSILDSFHAKNLTLYANSLELSTLNSLNDSKIEIENGATFGPIGNPMSNSFIQINNSNNWSYSKPDENLAVFNYFNYITNNSSIKINGNANLGKYIDKMDKKSEILVNGNTKVGYLKNINDQSFIKVTGNADFGSYIDVMEGGNILVKGNAKVGYLQNIKNQSTIHVNGKADFGSVINSMDNSKILVNGNVKGGYLQNIKNQSTIHVNGDADFGKYVETMEASNILVHGSVKVGYLQNIKNSNLHINGDADFGTMINSMDKSNILVNKNATVGSLKNIKNQSTIKINGDANFGTIIESIESSSLVNVRGNASVDKLIMKDGRMEVKGTLSITGDKDSTVNNGVVLVNRINVISPVNAQHKNLSITNGKLCIRDISNTAVLKDIKATGGSGRIIFLNKNLPTNQISNLDANKSNGNHVLEAGETQFIAECGTGFESETNTTSNSNTYDIGDGTMPAVEDITSTIEYQ